MTARDNMVLVRSVASVFDNDEHANGKRRTTKRLWSYARTRLIDRDVTVDLGHLDGGTCLGENAPCLIDASVLVATHRQISSALALVELDGAVRRLIVLPSDAKAESVDAIIEDAEIDTIVTDEPQRFSACPVRTVVPITWPATPVRRTFPREADTEWVLLTSGTAGRPKMVGYRLAALTGAVSPIALADPPPIWATFYDIRRYGGLQIFLRAVLGGSDLLLMSGDEAIGVQLDRLGRAGVTAISGTPSHWRRVLMSNRLKAFRPSYIRLSGEISDQVVLDGLSAAYPNAHIIHAYASTEAGVGFAVNDGCEGFPVSTFKDQRDGVEAKIVDGSLRLRSSRAASRYLGRSAPALAADDGFIDTGDLVERRGDRCYFVGRRGGIINVGGLKVSPEEVEAAINGHAEVRMSLVHSRKNPLTGAIVVADVVLRHPGAANDTLKSDILAICRHRLERHKVPAVIRFVPALTLTPGGKLSRTTAPKNA